MSAYVISSGVVSSGLNIAAGSTATVLNGGMMISAMDAGVEYLSSGGVDSGVTVEGGGLVYVSAGAQALAPTVAAKGRLTDYVGGVVTGATVSSRGLLNGLGALAGASTDEGLVESVTLKGTLLVASGAQTSSIIIAPGAVETVMSGALANGATIQSGGEMILEHGSLHVATILPGGLLSGPGKLTGAISDRGVVENVNVTGQIRVASGAVLSGGDVGSGVSGGGLAVAKGGALIEGMAVFSGGVLRVLQGGLTQGDVVDSGGAVQVYAGGVATGLMVEGGGSVVVSAAGSAGALTVSSGAGLIDDGLVTFVVSTGGADTFLGALTGSGTVSLAGAGTLILSGSESGFTGQVVISGGTVGLAATTGAGTAAIDWASTGTSATLKVTAADTPTAGSTFASPLENFDQTYDEVDLRALTFVSGATAVVSGATLALTDGGQVYDFALAGSSATTYSVGFDSFGGTVIHPVVSAASRLAEAMAAMAPSPGAGHAVAASAGVSLGEALIAAATASGGRAG